MGRRRFITGSLRNKLLIVLLASVICTLGILISLTYYYSRSYMKEQAISENGKLLYQSSRNIIWYFSQLEEETLVPYANDSLYNALSDRYTSDTETSKYIEDGLSDIRDSDTNIYQVYLYSDLLQQEYLATGDGGFVSQPVSADTHHQPIEKGLWIFPSHQSSTYGIPRILSDPSASVFTLRRSLYQIPENRYMGFIDIDIDFSYFETVFAPLLDIPEETICLLDPAGNILFSLGASLRDTQWLSLIDSDETSGNFPHTDSYSGKSYMVLYQKLESMGRQWIITKMIPTTYLYERATRLVLLNLFVGLCCLLVATVVMILISYRFTTPINRLVKHMERIGHGDMHDRLELSRSDEIGELARQFDLMMDHINNLVVKGYQMELANKTYQLKALQAQLDPHFINNAIQSIGTAALHAKALNVYELLSSFAGMMHYCMDLEHLVVPLEAELAYVKSYLELQSERFSGAFSYTMDVEPTALDMEVPKMILQPIVENSFKHGRIQEKGNGSLLIQISLDDDSLYIRIEDNGIGISPEALASLRFQTSMESDDLSISGTGHIGLRNLATRLRLYYGDTAALSLGDGPDGGFFVHIRLAGPILFKGIVSDAQTSEEEKK